MDTKYDVVLAQLGALSLRRSSSVVGRAFFDRRHLNPRCLAEIKVGLEDCIFEDEALPLSEKSLRAFLIPDVHEASQAIYRSLERSFSRPAHVHCANVLHPEVIVSNDFSTWPEVRFLF